MDSRTQRVRDDKDYVLEDNHLLGYPAKPSAPNYQGQIDILCAWLLSQQKKIGDLPKFIVSPSIFVPNGVETAGTDERSRRKKCEDDSWAAFPETRRQLLQTIVSGNIQNVVFLSGDVHCSNLAKITFTHKTAGQLRFARFALRPPHSIGPGPLRMVILYPSYTIPSWKATTSTSMTMSS